MGCTSCATGKPGGCNSKGGCGCGSGGCNRLNTYDWLTGIKAPDFDAFDIVEVSFKQGARKEFFHNPPHVRALRGDHVVVEADAGYDIGQVSLAGELVKMQMKKKRVRDNALLGKLIRRANERDLERLQEARDLERDTMIQARAIARTLDLRMKIGDVEYQGDKRKATFYYTADGRVDFRQLIRHYAKEFRVKIEMRQIGARQESARLGGIGSCGRELCCSTWLSDFKSVNTVAARYQNLAINQAKLSGQCGRLKCCLNYELDMYMEALEDFPEKAERLYTEAGTCVLIKTDIFKRNMHYVYQDGSMKGKFFALELGQVREVLQLNAKGKKPADLMAFAISAEPNANAEPDFDDDVTGVIDLPDEKRNKRKKRRKKKGGEGPSETAQPPKAKAPRPDGPEKAKTLRPDGPEKAKDKGPEAPPRKEEGRPNKPKAKGPREDRPPREEKKTKEVQKAPRNDAPKQDGQPDEQKKRRPNRRRGGKGGPAQKDKPDGPPKIG